MLSYIDPKARVAAAAALRAIAVRASNQFGYGGSNDIWMRRVLPMAYVGRGDPDAGSLFEEVWDEGGQVANLSETGPFAMLLEEKILPNLTKALIGALNDVSWERRVMACASLNDLCKKNILSPGPRTSSHDIYAQEDLRQRDSIRAESSKSILITCVGLIVKNRVWEGKSDLVETTASIASSWVSSSFEECKMNFDSNPISQDNFVWDDLFVGDSWFKNLNNDLVKNEDNTIEEDANPEATENGVKDEEMTDIENDMNDEILDIENDEDDEDDVDDDERAESSVSHPVTLSGLCRVFLQQGIKPSSEVKNSIFYSTDALSFRAASMRSLALLLKSLDNMKSLEHLNTNITPSLISMIKGNGEVYFHHGHRDFVDDKLPPLIIARAIDCLGSLMWKGMKYNDHNAYSSIQLLGTLLSKNCGEAQPAWTVREASATAMSKLALCANWAELTNIELINIFIKCSQSCVKDKKFWKVRFAKLKSLKCLCSRSKRGTSINRSDTNEEQLILEALLPLKEEMLKMAKSHLTDTESSVSAISSEIITSMAWWP